MDIAIAKNQGGREHMEDYSFALNLKLEGKSWKVGGVFDGHGGKEAAEAGWRMLPKLIEASFGYDTIQPLDVLKKVLLFFSSNITFEHVGTTVLLFIADEKELSIANIGDCRLVVYDSKYAKTVTSEHNISNREEAERIMNCGGFIRNNYIMHEGIGISLTRTVGMLHFRTVGVIPEPEFMTVPLERIDGFIAGSDGLWNHVLSSRAAELCRMSSTAESASQKILLEVLSRGKCRPDFHDNVTVIVGRK